MDYLQGLKLRKDNLYEKLEQYENADEFTGFSIIRARVQIETLRVNAQIEILDELINELEAE